MRVLMCGSRGYTDSAKVWDVLCDLKRRYADLMIIEGTAEGADQLAGELATRMGIEVEEYPPDWGRYGNGAGIVRNKQMLDEGEPDLVVAFSVKYPLTRGTEDMVERAQEAGLPIEIHIPPGLGAPPART